MSICIAGMHRSGTSMVSGLLHEIGVYLGEEPDFLAAKEGENADGFWEHFGFYALNERLLLHLRAGWDAPWIPDGWEAREDLAPFREEARLLADRMRGLAGRGGRWGWKDPRNSITIPFWRSLLPDVKIVICVRNPVEVAASLRKRNNLSVAASSRLWLRYYENLLSHVPRGNRVITLYENYFEKFEQELGRVCSALGLAVGGGVMARARACAKPELRHNRATCQELRGGDFAPELIRIYDALLEEAGTGEAFAGQSITPEIKEAHPVLSGEAPDFARSRFNAETAQREEYIRRLIQENRMLTEKLAGLELRLDELAEQVNAPKPENLAHLQLLAALVEKAIGDYGAVAGRRAQLLALQNKVEMPMNDKKSTMPRWIRRSQTFNSLFRHMKRIRKMRKLLFLQCDLNEAMAQSLGALTDVTAQMARGGAPMDATPAGLEQGGTDKTPVGISELAILLRARLL